MAATGATDYPVLHKHALQGKKKQRLENRRECVSIITPYEKKDDFILFLRLATLFRLL